MFKLHAAPQQYKQLTIYAYSNKLFSYSDQKFEMTDENLIFERVAHYFGLLADPTRLRILSFLCVEERAVKNVVEKIGLTQANVSRHLNILFRAGVVGRRREGNSVFYRVIDPNFVDICRTVSITVACRDIGQEFGIAVA